MTRNQRMMKTKRKITSTEKNAQDEGLILTLEADIKALKDDLRRVLHPTAILSLERAIDRKEELLKSYKNLA